MRFMERILFGLSPIMVFVFLLSLIFVSKFSYAVRDHKEIATKQSQLQTYIVHIKEPEGGQDFSKSEDLESWYKSFLPASSPTSNSQQRLVYSYRNVLTGFAAKLTQEEVKAMEEKDGFVLAWPEKIYHLQITRSPAFLGLHQNSGFWNGSNYGKGVIIAVVDSGISSHHPSFSDEGMPPPPAKWKGKCAFYGTICNNKIISASNFVESLPPTEDFIHGTPVASIAAGNFVEDARDLFGNAKGTAAGMAPHAHLAIYKACGELGCTGSAILAAIDAAIEDSVDVLSISLAADHSDPFYVDEITIGAFAATRKGIFVSTPAENEGPRSPSLSNGAPWVLTVGASTIDRSIRTTANLGNGEYFDGESFFQLSDFPSKLLPLVYAGANGNVSSAFCNKGSLKDMDVRGKIVVCDTEDGAIYVSDKEEEVKNAGGVAIILPNNKYRGFSTSEIDADILPATHLSYSSGLKIKAFINSTTKPTATIEFKGTIIGISSAPEVAHFSSRGPSLTSPGILKPDIIGPRANILAAWSANRMDSSSFNIVSGTSLSCLHLSGVAALLKSSHPEWSPAAIKSAIMTTADEVNHENKPIMDQTHQPADIFAVGAGHVNPSRANDPGLIYDIQPEDYIHYLCGLGYSNSQVGIVVNRRVNCSEESTIPEAQLNYPSFSIALGCNTTTQEFTRTVTNVGAVDSTYIIEIFAPPGVNVSVKPDKLDFTRLNQKKTYAVMFSKIRTKGKDRKPHAQGFLRWVSAKHSVRSPISVKFE